MTQQSMYFRNKKVPGTKDVWNLQKSKKQDLRTENTQRNSNMKAKVKKISDIFIKN